MTLSETIGSGYYAASGLQTNVGSAFTLLPGEYDVSLYAATTDWGSTGIAELQLLQSDGTAIGLGASVKSGLVKATTAVNTRGVVELAGGQYKIAVTAPAANVKATVARIVNK